jgi:hypothetical protein
MDSDKFFTQILRVFFIFVFAFILLLLYPLAKKHYEKWQQDERSSINLNYNRLYNYSTNDTIFIVRFKGVEYGSMDMFFVIKNDTENRLFIGKYAYRSSEQIITYDEIINGYK